LILPKWIGAAQKRTLERTRRPIIAADIARFAEDTDAREKADSRSPEMTDRPHPAQPTAPQLHRARSSIAHLSKTAELGNGSSPISDPKCWSPTEIIHDAAGISRYRS
jgi:hypothetical protein